ncbi:hypothetical protein CFP75_38280 [Amycolatopsis alba DSM 44262]|uniref:Uncharacterized protein n=2 Tax=Amycolatopsis alba TaxID=76020 RepID=A0A229R9V7_AMYAL|nr:hypothetical protein [Amycolatopsis alba]OXM43427.1 hypothetical protein CFP75_38280 [Amycolatopsis alba DSM 44262]
MITASASVLVAVLVFVLNQRAQIRQERRQARLARVNSQLRELCGPLNALVEVNERVWKALRDSGLPGKAKRSPSGADRDWRRWRSQALQPVNLQMRDLIVEHADLLIEPELPQALRDFCAHATAVEIVLAAEADGAHERALIAHPGAPFATYVREAFLRLKHEQQHLLAAVNRPCEVRAE